jgi:glycosyltransferase involved in cell wall biosynthesis
MLHSMLRPLVERGHQVRVWLSHPGKIQKSYRIDGVQVVPYEESTDFAADIQNSDVLLSQYENVPIATNLARTHGIPVVVICHDNFATTFHNAAGADLVVYNSEWIRRDGEIFYARYPREFLPRRTMVVRPPVIADDYRTEPGECVTLVNLNSDKGGDIFWQIAAWLPECRFLGVRGAYGQQTEPPPYLSNGEVIDGVSGDEMRTHVYSRSRVMVMPSLYESWGRVAVEAFASGIPVVAHPTPGLVEALGSAGIFAYRDDINAWIQALRSLRDPANWERASRRAKARSDELSANSDIDAWCDAVESICDTRRQTHLPLRGLGPLNGHPTDPVAAREAADSLKVTANLPVIAKGTEPRPASVPVRVSTADGNGHTRLRQAQRDPADTHRELHALDDRHLADDHDAEGAGQRLDHLLRYVQDLADELRRAEEEYRRAQAAELADHQHVRTAAHQVREVRRRAHDFTAQVVDLTSDRRGP